MPIIPDEARTFGIDALFADAKIYSPTGQLYEPVDAALVLSYREAKNGQILEEGITEAGATASFTAASTSYATWGQPMIPFFVLYSMFGFQRVGDLLWHYGDQRGRGFLLGATAGRTTLTGEGLQHMRRAEPPLRARVPELPRVRPGVRVRGRGARARRHRAHVRARARRLLLLPDPLQRELLAARDARRCRRRHRARPLPLPRAEGEHAHRAQVLASGTMVLQALEAQRMLAEHHDVALDVWSAPGWKQLREDALACERWNRLHPLEAPRTPYVTEQLRAPKAR